MAKSVLIIEDYPETLDLLKALFVNEGYDVKIAVTGEAALEIAARDAFDVIILDIMLPRIDGFEVCRRIKANSKTKNIPVVVVTAFDVPDIVKRCTAAGADEVVLKPFDPADLVSRVKKRSKT